VLLPDDQRQVVSAGTEQGFIEIAIRTAGIVTRTKIFLGTYIFRTDLNSSSAYQT
jgi:hypothetical protein